MSRIITLLAALVLLFGTTELRAQGCSGTSVSQDCTWTAQVTVQATLSCSVVRSFAFGSWPSSIGSVGSNENNHGRLRCTTDPGNSVNISFTLASSLTNGAFSVPVTYGDESARAYDCDGSCGPVRTFNPATGTIGFPISSGVLVLALGENGANQQFSEVSVNLSGAAAGTYQGVIVATIALQ